MTDQTAYPRREVHITDLTTFKRCRRLWDYTSHMRQNLQRKAPVLPFFSGSGGHEALQVKYETGRHAGDHFTQYANKERTRLERTLGPLWPGQEVAFEEQVALMVDVLSHYEIWVASDKSVNGDHNLDFLALEHRGKVPLFPLADPGLPQYDVDYGFTFDGVVKRKSDGSTWLFETKTCRSIEERKKLLANDEQSAMYIYAAEKLLGIRIDGVLYNLLRKKAPTVAQPLVRAELIGGHMVHPLSQAKATDTTFEYYKAQLRSESDKDETLYKALIEYHKAMLEHLWQKGNTFFERYELRKPRAVVDNVVHYTRLAALEALNPDVWIYPNGGQLHCTYCQFRAPCLMEDAGADTSELLLEEYERRQPRQDLKLEDL